MKRRLVDSFDEAKNLKKREELYVGIGIVFFTF